MKRVHRNWHRRIGWLLVPAVVLTLGWVSLEREPVPDNATLPPTLIQSAMAGGR